MRIEVRSLERSFDVPSEPIYLPSQAEMAKVLPQLRGKRMSIEFDQAVDGPQTVARLIRETFEKCGVTWLSLPQGSQAHVWIQGGSNEMRFAFVVADPMDEKKPICGECGPRELTATVMSAICDFMNSPSVPASATEKDSLEEVLNSVADLNRKLTTVSLAMETGKLPGLMSALAKEIHKLGRIGALLHKSFGVNSSSDIGGFC